MAKLFGILLFVLVFACDVHDDRLKIVNRSDKVICFDYEVDTILNVPSVNKKEVFIGARIDPGDTSRVLLEGSRTRWITEVSGGKDSTLSIFIFDYDKVLGSDWDTLRINKEYKRLDYKLGDLIRNNWTVIVE